MTQTQRRAVGIALFPLLLVAGCDGSVLDLGTSDAGDASPFVQETLACPPINETQYDTLRGATCGGVCSDEIGTPRALVLPEEMAAALAGPWTLCAGALGPSDTAGIELDPGCVVYLLREGEGGVLARGTSAAYQGTFDVISRGTTTLGVALHLSTGTIEASVLVSQCLGRARLSLGPGASAASIELAAIASLDGGVAH